MRARVFPRFTLAEDPGDELESAFSSSDELLTHLQAGGHDFPVDDWLYGAARVRERLAHWSKALVLSEALGRGDTELTPMQLPHKPDDRWAALELPEEYVLSGEKLLYTACLSVPVTADSTHTGIIIDEWTEIVPTRDEVTGVAFHYDRPNGEPMQSILVVSPPAFTGSWRWRDLFDSISETLDQAKMRAIEPSHVAESGYAQFLPATLFPVASTGLTMTLDLAANHLAASNHFKE